MKTKDDHLFQIINQNISITITIKIKITISIEIIIHLFGEVEAEIEDIVIDMLEAIHMIGIIIPGSIEIILNTGNIGIRKRIIIIIICMKIGRM